MDLVSSADTGAEGWFFDYEDPAGAQDQLEHQDQSGAQDQLEHQDQDRVLEVDVDMDQTTQVSVLPPLSPLEGRRAGGIFGSDVAIAHAIDVDRKRSHSPARVKAKVKEQRDAVLMFRQPLSVSTIVVHGCEFAVHTELLCKDSAYFSRALRGAFAESATQRIVFDAESDDITVEDFGLWVDLLYRAHFNTVTIGGAASIAATLTASTTAGLPSMAGGETSCKKAHGSGEASCKKAHGSGEASCKTAHGSGALATGSFLMRKEQMGGTLSTRQILTLWQLSDRFLHKPLAALAEESLQHRLSLYSVEQWRKLYRTRPMSDIRNRVSRLQDAYRQCIDGGLPFADDVATACAQCPPQVYAACVDLLQPEFMALVSRKMIMSAADPMLLGLDQRRMGINRKAYDKEERGG